MSSSQHKIEFKLKSEDDLETVLFTDLQSLLRDISNTDLYTIRGNVDTNIIFPNSATLSYFFVLMNELWSQASTRIVKSNGKNLNISNLDCVQWFLDKSKGDSVVDGSNLSDSLKKLNERIRYVEQFEVYNGNETLVFPLS